MAVVLPFGVKAPVSMVFATVIETVGEASFARLRLDPRRLDTGRETDEREQPSCVHDQNYISSVNEVIMLCRHVTG